MLISEINKETHWRSYNWVKKWVWNGHSFHFSPLLLLLGFYFSWIRNHGWSQNQCNCGRSRNTIKGPTTTQYVSRHVALRSNVLFWLYYLEFENASRTPPHGYHWFEWTSLLLKLKSDEWKARSLVSTGSHKF